MKIRLHPILLCMCLLLLSYGCSQKFERITIFLKNPADINYKDAPIVIHRSAFDIADSTLIPIIIDQHGNYVPCQSDDTNQDGIWDELTFVYDFDRFDSLHVYIEWMKPNQLPQFEQRTNVRIAKMSPNKGPLKEVKMDYHTHDLTAMRNFNPYQLEGPSLENDNIGFRHIFDGSKTHSLMGKRTQKMVLDSVGIMTDGTVGDTYHNLAGWGMDLLKASNSTGIGGISLLTDSAHIRLGVANTFETDNVDSCSYTLIAEGPIRSIVRFDYFGWDTGKKKMNVTEYITIRAGERGYEVKVITEEQPDSCFIATGIPIQNLKEENETEWESNLNFRDYEEGFVAMMTHALQSPRDQYYLGMAIVIPKENFVKTFTPGKKKKDLLDDQWSAALKKNKNQEISYYVYGCWELSDEGFKSADYFVDFIDKNVIRLNHPIEWKITGVANTLPPVISNKINETL